VNVWLQVSTVILIPVVLDRSIWRSSLYRACRQGDGAGKGHVYGWLYWPSMRAEKTYF